MHRAFFFGILMALGLAGANGQASSCSVDSIANIEGISGDNDNGVVCCPLECGQCGGGGCGQAGAGNTECCVNGVLENQPHCYDEPVAPCVIDRFDDVCNPDPCPENSVCDVGGYSTTYGGLDLQAFCWCVEGYENTNTFQSTSNNRPERGITCTLIDPCSTNPCGDNSLCEVQKLDVSPDTFTPAFAVCSCEEGFDNTGPSDEPGEIMCTNGDGPVCSNGVPGIEGENGNGKVCCPVGCNGCGGTGCGRIGAAAGLNNKDCCINGVLNNQPDCADADGTAPCVIETF